MKSQTHFAAALALSPAAFLLTNAEDPASALFAAFAFVAGAKAPDWLEIRWWLWGHRISVIPHRTLTHTWWIWVGVALGSYFAGVTGAALAMTMAFCASCLLHIFMDSLTPMGVPVWNPFGERRRLNLGWLSSDLAFLVALAPVSLVLWKFSAT